MKIILILMYSISVNSQDKLFPDIEDLFQTFKEPLNVQPQGDVFIKNISIDVEKINIQKFKRKFNVTTNFTNYLTNIRSIDLNDTRRIDWVGSRSEWYKASEYSVKLKLLDLMLQLIYMARHKLKRLEAEKYFNPKDTSYRIAFLYRRLIRIYKKMTDIYTTMWNKRDFFVMDPHLILHHKAAKQHVDFLYLWWVLVKLNEKYMIAHGIPNVVPDE